ncbi:MAG: exodeoxyribonuclease VII large subunit [Thermodesulfobacteriota bacterium]
MNEILTVSALNDRIRTLLEKGFDLLWVEGEVSNLRRPDSGHVYFTLKDAKSQIRAVIFRSPYAKPGWKSPSGFVVEEGMGIVCRARLAVYPPRGEYQLIIDTVEPRGIGALQKAFEQLKARLEAEGLFDKSRKNPLPFLPSRIGVVTSPSGAVIRDILTVTGRRFPSVDILIAPVRVQGTEAPAEITRALADLQNIPRIDVIILARGGGSLEDLAPFNTEEVARAIARSRIPVVSAIGHETDFTIADFTADLRAPTPSAAAELVVPLRTELIETLQTLELRMNRHRRREAQRLRDRIASLSERLRDPKRRLAEIRIALDDNIDRMRMALSHLRKIRRQGLIHLHVRLEHRNPRTRIAQMHRDVGSFRERLRTAVERREQQWKNRVRSSMALLDSLSPFSILGRGYSITRRLPDGLILRDAGEVTTGQEVDIRLSLGSLRARVAGILREQ